MALFSDIGEPAYFVGGCVRNSLFGVPVSDLDISTPVRPELILNLAQKAGLKVIPTGIEHGTVTVIAEGEPFEITTFRKDVETDGRRAVVAFSTHMEDDARRRDFTMNAIYADATGTIIDPLGGLPDLRAGRVRFIDNPDLRIKEDYLRILRFFRFYAWYGDHSAGLDPDGLAACATHLDGLTTLSRERVGAEIIKLLSAPSPDQAIGAMDQSGVLNTLLPGASTKAFFLLTSFETHPDPILRLAALGDFDVAGLLRLSRAQCRRYATYRECAVGPSGLAEIAYRENADIARAVSCLRAAFFEQPVSQDAAVEIAKGATAIFPLVASDLIPELTGPALGAALKAAEQAWIESGFTLDRHALIKRAKDT
ncbi:MULTISPECIES: CCA tRNA nucleotidyltransferase [Roseobacteraceae]|uniref:Polynucleotide adenylyltransferase n=1 Tax=Celeribacter baekdonensis B30 TaxID=1208323 RepID=K2KAV8_9RHOB|nr:MULTISPECIES: CCA tRNA nucleotidyltransferase [Roseobacteraceae]EKE74510.1 polynucleotide adenylyltransferase [Celeribacter baekdonensis B30]KAB6716572.1 CCA tRNA nucleotidyltransferase [Roseobacter sp. TSBP12]|tara:strand:- start:973 stop:2076 length:1104 start_codon:yes stop_codon:yes gene_type:complete